MSIIIYGIKNCSTMKKAFDKLDCLGIPYEFFDYKKQSLDKDTLVEWVNQMSLEKIMNTKGMTWRKLSEIDKVRAKQDKNFAIELMLSQPSMIKRPIVISDKKQMVGFDEMAFEQLVN